MYVSVSLGIKSFSWMLVVLSRQFFNAGNVGAFGAKDSKYCQELRRTSREEQVKSTAKLGQS